MSLFQNDILENQTVLSNRDYHVVLYNIDNKYTPQPITAPFNGTVLLNPKGKNAVLSIKSGDFILYLTNSSIDRKNSLKSVKSGDKIGYTTNTNINQIYGVEAWLEKNGEIVDILPYLLRRDKTKIKSPSRTRKRKVTESAEADNDNAE